MTIKRWIFALVYLLMCCPAWIAAQSTPPDRPLILPVQGAPGANTWLFAQGYGNTKSAYNFASDWYGAGQGLHFGLDFSMPCGTPLVAVADGEVAYVDNLGYGATPHNLILRHEALGIATLYGHLLEAPALTPGQFVRQGNVIALSGDPDLTCDSRPHLHFEVRSLDLGTAYNPIPYMEANWHSLALVTGFETFTYEQDLFHPRRWMTLEDQPTATFGGRRLNAYDAAWPLRYDDQAPTNPPLDLGAHPLPDAVSATLQPIGAEDCCWAHRWHPIEPATLFTIDGEADQRARIIGYNADSGAEITGDYPATPTNTSPDGAYAVYSENGYARIVNLQDESEWRTPFLGGTPALNTDNTRLLWVTRTGSTVPGQARPIASVWVAGADGFGAVQLVSGRGLSAQWLDADRILINQNAGGLATTLTVWDLRAESQIDLGTYYDLMNLSVSPGGRYLMFDLLFQENPDESGVYLLETSANASPQRMDWFGAYRWRDTESVFVIPYDPSADYHTLMSANIRTGDQRVLVTPQNLPFTIMNGDWEVSADGERIVFHNGVDRRMTVLTLDGEK